MKKERKKERKKVGKHKRRKKESIRLVLSAWLKNRL